MTKYLFIFLKYLSNNHIIMIFNIKIIYVKIYCILYIFEFSYYTKVFKICCYLYILLLSSLHMYMNQWYYGFKIWTYFIENANLWIRVAKGRSFLSNLRWNCCLHDSMLDTWAPSNLFMSPAFLNGVRDKF